MSHIDRRARSVSILENAIHHLLNHNDDKNSMYCEDKNDSDAVNVIVAIIWLCLDVTYIDI